MRFFIVIALLFLMISSCEKQPFDYRVKYLGNYDLSYIHENRLGCIDSSYTGCEVITRGNVRAEITLSKSYHNKIFLKIDKEIFNPKLDKNGYFIEGSNYAGGIEGNIYESGEIRIEKIYSKPYWFKNYVGKQVE